MFLEAVLICLYLHLIVSSDCVIIRLLRTVKWHLAGTDQRRVRSAEWVWSGQTAISVTWAAHRLVPQRHRGGLVVCGGTKLRGHVGVLGQ